MYSLRAGINPSVARECGSVLRIRSSICTTPFAAASVAVATIAMATERNSATWVMLAADELTDHGQDLGVPERAGANSGRCERYRIGRCPPISVGAPAAESCGNLLDSVGVSPVGGCIA